MVADFLILAPSPMAFPATASLHYERNVFTSLFNMMSREVLDAQSKQPTFFFKMDFSNNLSIYADKSKQRLLLRAARAPLTGGGFAGLAALHTWDIFDSENNDKPLGRVKANLMQSALSMGKEAWEITTSDGKPLLVFKADASETLGKRILDNLSDLYNPTHQYHLFTPDDKPAAHVFLKQGLFKFQYDLLFEPKVGDVERKMAVALFAGLTLMLKK